MLFYVKLLKRKTQGGIPLSSGLSIICHIIIRSYYIQSNLLQGLTMANRLYTLEKGRDVILCKIVIKKKKRGGVVRKCNLRPSRWDLTFLGGGDPPPKTIEFEDLEKCNLHFPRSTPPPKNVNYISGRPPPFLMIKGVVIIYILETVICVKKLELAN